MTSEIRWIVPARFGAKTGDITREPADAIVNAANSSLLGGDGVDGAIHKKGGPAILEQCRTIRRERYPDGLPAGSAVMTTAGNLPSKHVIHTVGPIWRGGAQGEVLVLAGAYRACLEQARGLELVSLAFPAISTGVYGFPKDKAAVIACDTVADFLDAHEYPRQVLLVFFTQQDTDIFFDSI